jgi:DNA mismatch repair protein MutS2
MSTSGSGAWLASACSAKSRSDLEWGRLLEALAKRCAGPLGARSALALPFLTTREDVLRSLQEVSEAVALAQAHEPLPGSGSPVVSVSLERLRAGGALGPTDLLDIAKLLSHARVLRRFLHARRSRAPNLTAACAIDPHLDVLADEIHRCFEPDGTLSDQASPALRELRVSRSAARTRLLNKLDDIMQRYAPTLQDTFYTEREGRFVLPVRADSHERFAGIVHGTSGSGQTLFMEPRAIIPLGNRLKVIDAELEREELAVYARLSASLSDDIEMLSAAQQALAHAELRAACAQLALDLDLSFPHVDEEPLLDLIGARHPLLQLDGVEVVASDVRVESGAALILSGPNAGGKTVVLKTLGLVALMVRAGLPLPCDPKSRVGVFETVASDMGDEQSIARNLSTFSAHVRNLASILDVTARGTLVLLDEIATGTDPRQGEALATGVLDGLCARGGAVACTTHYEGLKALALGDGRFQNASVGFDMATMSPTFKLVTGIPGASSALAIAKRFGMPSLIVERAERYLGEEERGFDELVRKLNDERRALELARAAAEREREELARARHLLDAELAHAKARERKVVTEQTQALLSAVRRAREDLRVAQQRLRARKLDKEQVRQAARVIEHVAQKVALGGPLELAAERAPQHAATPLSAEALRAGTRVFVPRLRGEAVVLEVLGNGHVRVAMGAVKVAVHAAELRSAASCGEPPPTTQPLPRRPSPPLDAAADPDVPIQTSDNRCDLRGLRMDEAVAMSEQFLDRCLNEGKRVAFLIHGHGTGVLRDAVRDALTSSPYVLRSRPGGPGEGGDGVTVVWLR